MCDPQPVGAPWRAHRGLLPANAVVCGPNRVIAAKPSKTPDDYPPTQLFVFYRDADVRATYDAMIDRFKSTVSHKFALGGGSDAHRTFSIGSMRTEATDGQPMRSEQDDEDVCLDSCKCWCIVPCCGCGV